MTAAATVADDADDVEAAAEAAATDVDVGVGADAADDSAAASGINEVAIREDRTCIENWDLITEKSLIVHCNIVKSDALRKIKKCNAFDSCDET